MSVSKTTQIVVAETGLEPPLAAFYVMRFIQSFLPSKVLPRDLFMIPDLVEEQVGSMSSVNALVGGHSLSNCLLSVLVVPFSYFFTDV